MIEYAPKIEKDMSHDQAWLHCLTLDYNGHKDWRLPTYREYETSKITMSWFEDRFIALPVIIMGIMIGGYLR
jgi:hypothetical protein